MVQSDSYIDADQHTLSTATPTFGILQREGRSSYPRSVRAYTAKRSKPPQPFLGLPRVNGEMVAEEGNGRLFGGLLLFSPQCDVGEEET